MSLTTWPLAAISTIAFTATVAIPRPTQAAVSVAAHRLDQDGEDEKGTEERDIKVEDLPKKVSDAVIRAFPDAKITEAEEQTHKGTVTYEVEVSVGDKHYELKVSADGKIISRKSNDDDDNGKAGDDK